MTEEKYIEEKVGKRNPFRVPEEYFSQFTAQMMERLPEREPKAKIIWLRKPVYYAAACVCALLVLAAGWLLMPESDVRTSAPVQLSAQQQSADEALDEAADYMMLDNHDIYAYLSEN